MAIVAIPTRTDVSTYSFTIDLDSVVYTITLIFNVRSNHWYMNIADIDGVPLREGIKLVTNWTLTHTWIQQGHPDGELIPINAENDDDPDRDTLGAQSVLSYDEGGAFG